MSQIVIQQRKILKNLQQRQYTLKEENEQIYSNLGLVVDHDSAQKKLTSLNNQVLLNKKDQEVLNQ